MAARSPQWLAIRLSELPLECHDLTTGSDEAIVVSDHRQVCCATRGAFDRGVEPGMAVSTARLLSGALVIERDRQREQQHRQQLAETLYAFTPHIEPCVPATGSASDQSGLLLELSSCLRLFGGLDSLLRRIDAHLRQQPLTCHLGLAPSGTAAWLLSWLPLEPGDDPVTVCVTGCEPGQCLARLQGLPVTLLQAYPDAVETLQKTGFSTLGDIFRQLQGRSLAAFRKRLGTDFTAYLADLLAVDDHWQQAALFARPKTSFQPRETFVEHIQFDYPVVQVDHLRDPVATLLQSLTAWLVRRQQQCQTLHWYFLDIHKQQHQLTVSCEGVYSRWQLAFDLTLIRLETQPLPFEVDLLELRVAHTIPATLPNGALRLPGHPGHGGFEFREDNRETIDREQLATTLARLGARLGDDTLYRVGCRDANIPEQAAATLAIGETPEQYLRGDHASAPRPQWLLIPPVAIGKHRNSLHWRGKIELLHGPERIEGDWWQAPVARDYYLARRHDNLRLWVYRDLHREQWYVQGIFS